MLRAMKRALLLGMVLLVQCPAAAHGDLLANSEAKGESPGPVLHNAVLGPSTPLRLVVNASSGRVLAVTFRLDCYRDGAHRRKRFKLPRRTPINRRVSFPIQNPDFCFVDAKASFDDLVDGDGWIVVKLYGRAELTAPLRLPGATLSRI
jgi:hypothetical protein